MVFKSGYFTFAGYNSRRFDLILTSIDQVEESANRVVGLNRSVNSNKNGVIYTLADEVELELQFAFSRNGVYITPNKKQLREVELWLFRGEEFKCLSSSGGVFYYVIFTEGSFNSSGNYYTCKVLSQPYCYTSVYVNSSTVIGERDIEEKCLDITGVSTSIFEIKSLVNEAVTISNGRNTFSINMLANEIVSIDSDCKEIISNMDGVYSRFSGSYLDLNYGINRIHISTSSAAKTEVVIKHQDRLSLGTR